MRLSVPLLAGLATLPTGVLSWATDLRLSWPAPHYEELTQGDPPRGPDGEKFPCRDVVPPANVQRVPWPMTGTSVRLQRSSSLSNRTEDISTSFIGTWNFRFAFGQFEGLDLRNSTTPPRNPVVPLGTDIWQPEQFEIGGWCTASTGTFNYVEEDNADGAPRSDRIFDSDLEGVNATLGFYLRQKYGGSVTVSTQCVYVQFVTGAPKGPCKRPSTLPEDRVDTIYPGGPGGGDYPYSGPDSALLPASTGMIIGFALGLPFILFLIFLCYRSNKKGRAANLTRMSREEAIELRNKRVNGAHNEQLPAYSGPPPRYDTGMAASAPGAGAAAATATSAGATGGI